MSNVASIKQIMGLDSNSNPISVINNLAKADDVVLNRTGAISKRKGFDYYIGYTAALPTSLWEFNSQIVYHENATSKICYGTTTISGTYPAPASNKVRTVTTRSNNYLTTANGIFKQTSYNTVPYKAGVPPALDTSVTSGGTVGGWMTASQVAYRVTWQRTDANGMLVTGAPSQPFLFTNNTGSTIAPSVTFSVPFEALISDVWQLWRTTSSASSSINPGDTMYLVTTGIWSSGTTISYIDSTPDASLSSTALYTNSNNQGIASANYPPPLC